MTVYDILHAAKLGELRIIGPAVYDANYGYLGTPAELDRIQCELSRFGRGLVKISGLTVLGSDGGHVGNSTWAVAGIDPYFQAIAEAMNEVSDTREAKALLSGPRGDQPFPEDLNQRLK